MNRVNRNFALPAIVLAVLLAAAPTARAGDPRLVHFKATAAFDPRQSVPDLADSVPEGPALKSTIAAEPVLVVQYAEPVTFGRQAELGALGLKVLDYVPENAVLARSRAGLSIDQIRSLPGVRAVFELAPGFKLSPELAALVAKDAAPISLATPSPATPSPLKSSMIEASLFTGGDAAALGKAVLEAAPGVTVAWMRKSDPGRVRFVVPAVNLKAVAGGLAAHPEVEFVEIAHEPEHHNDNSVWIGQSYDRASGIPEAQAPDPKPYTLSGRIWGKGLLGQGQIVGVTDEFLDVEAGQFRDLNRDVVPQTVQLPGPLSVDLSHRKIVALNYPGLTVNPIPPHECVRHGTHTSGSVLGDCLTNPAGPFLNPGHDTGDGMAPLARLVFEWGAPGDGGDVSDLLQQQYNAGARLSSFSWRMTGHDVDYGVWRLPDMTVFASAGNDGVTAGHTVPGSIGSNNKNAIIVGASENYSGTIDPENMVAFSSEGPTSDGRIKPDLAIPGYLVRSAKPPTVTYTNPNDPHCNPNDPNYCSPRSAGGCFALDTTQSCGTDFLSGTSMSAPTAAGLGALARQYFTSGYYPTGQASAANALTPSAALMKAVLINGARNMTGRNREMRGTPIDFGPLADAPANKQGWGRIALDDALYFSGDSRRLWLAEVSNTQGVFTNDSARYDVTITGASAAEPLKVTLVWTDPPAASGASIDLRNNLDLVVTAPNGTVYRGNQWIDDPGVQGDKRSLSNATGADSLNNVEGILVPAPASGVYRVEIRGANVPGYVPDNLYKQGFALVVTAAGAALQGQPCTTAAPPPNPSAGVQRWDDVLVTWTAVPGAVGYKVRRNSTGCLFPPSVIFDVPAGQTSYHDTTTQPATTYIYTVRAVMSADGCQTADSACTTPVTTPQAPSITGVSPGYGLNNNPTVITVSGANFTSSPTVPRIYLGTASQPQKYELAPVTFLSSSQIRATVPVNLQSGAYTVKVVNADTLSASLANGFTVSGPLQSTIAFTSDSGISQTLNGSLSAVNVDTMTLIEKKDLGPNSRVTDVAVRKDGTLGVLTSYISPLGVSAFSPATRQIIRSVAVPGGQSSSGVVIHPSGNPAYVLTSSTSTPIHLRSLDLNTFTFTGDRVLGSGAGGDIEISPDGSLVFVTNEGEDSVSVVRTSDLVELARVPVFEDFTGQDFPLRLAISSDGSRLYAANYSSDTISVIIIDPVTPRYVLDRRIDVSDHLGWTTNRPHALALSGNNAVLHVGNHFCCQSATNRANVDLTTDQRTALVSAGGYQWQNFAFLQSTGKLYGLGFGAPAAFVRFTPGTLAIEATALVGDASNGLAIAEPAPLTITSVNPIRSCHYGGTVVTITGSGFQGEVRNDAGAIVQQRTRVFFGGTESTSVTLVNSTTLSAVTPPHAGSTTPVPVMVFNPNGKTATLSGVFRYGTCITPKFPGGDEEPQ